ncbi:MAG: surface polysaccharide O-acyltransferase-like enzyme [Flavobacterium sp.]
MPLLLAAVTILPLTMVAMVSFMASARFGTHQFLITEAQLKIIIKEIQAAGMPADQPSLGHLWFLYYLLHFYLTIPICFVVSRWTVKFNLSSVITSPLFCVALGAYTAATLWFFRGGVLFEGFIFIKPHPPSLLYYGSFFFLGFMFHSHRGILETFRNNVKWFAAASLALFPVAMYFTHMDFATEATLDFHAAAVISNALELIQ